MPPMRSDSGAGNIKAILAAGLTAAVMLSILDIRGVRTPEWLKRKVGIELPNIDITRTEKILADMKENLDSVRDRVGSGISSGGLSDKEKKEVEKFLDSEEAGKMVRHEPTQFGSAWYFLKPEWIDRDVLRVVYEDGHRQGLMILRVATVRDGRPEFRVLLDSLTR